MGDDALKLRMNRILLDSGFGGGRLRIRRISFERRSLRSAILLGPVTIVTPPSGERKVLEIQPLIHVASSLITYCYRTELARPAANA